MRSVPSLSRGEAMAFKPLEGGGCGEWPLWDLFIANNLGKVLHRPDFSDIIEGFALQKA